MPPRPGTDGAVRGAPGTATGPSEQRVATVLAETLAYARERAYRGWDVDDWASSRLLGALPGDGGPLARAVRGVARRAPLNVRPLLLVEPRRSYRGAALLATANRNAHWLHERSPTALPAPAAGYREEQRVLLEWLVEHGWDGYGGFCAADRYGPPVDGRARVDGGPTEPDVASTAHAAAALLRGKYVAREYAEVARSAATFLLEDLGFRAAGDGDGAVVDPRPGATVDECDVAATAIGARLLVDVHDYTREPRLAAAAGRLLDTVAARQTARGTWEGRDPPAAGDPRRSHHDGAVLESFQRFATVVDEDRHRAARTDGLDYYRRVLFEPDGAPKFAASADYPRDVRAAAQGILVFSYAGDYGSARQIVEWTLDELYLGDGRFLFRKHRFHDKHHVLMRSCVAWMAYALSEYLRCRYVD